MNVIKEMVEFDQLLEDMQEDADQEDELGIDPLNSQLDDDDGMDDDTQTAFMVMKDMMEKFKEFCDCCESAWKVQEIPAALRQRLITLDQHNQDRYQKMYLMIQKYADQMKKTKVSNYGE